MSHADGDEKKWKAFNIMVQNWPFTGRKKGIISFGGTWGFDRKQC